MVVFLILGAILGSAFALVMGGVLAAGFGVGLGALAGLVGVVSGWLLGILGAVSLAGGLAFAFVVWFVVLAVVYAMGALTLLGATAGAPPAGTATAVGPTALDSISRGFAVGSTAVGNLMLLLILGAAFPPALILAWAIFAVGLLCVFPALTRSAAFQAVLGWVGWLMPLNWALQVFGLLVFLVNAVSAIFSGAWGVRLDVSTGTVESTGGGFVLWLAGLTGATGGAWNMGNFTFLAGALGSGIRTPFGAPGLSAHETGHTLAVAAYGMFFLLADAIDENVPPLARGASAYGELIAESHLPSNGFFYLPAFSA